MKYVKPKLYHKVIKEISNTIEKITDDPRSLDRTFWTDFVEFSDPILKDKLLTTGSDKISKQIVESSSIYMISQMILQYTLFHRVLRKTGEDEIPYPKEHQPYYLRQTDSKGNEMDFYDLHSLNLMKHHYDNEDKTLNELMED